MSRQSANLTVLVNNHAYAGLMIEHGFSLWIESENKHILYDTGQGLTLEPNAQKLNVDLSKTDSLVLSHGHYDHAGGVGKVLQLKSSIHLYCHSKIASPRYSVQKGTTASIGIPRESLETIKNWPPGQVHWVSGPVWLSDTIGITGPIPRKTSFEDTGGPFFLDPEGNRPDPIYDDLALFIKTKKGVVVCVGCCHAGLINTLNYIQQLTQGVNVHAIIGGLHLVNANEQRMQQTIDTLKSLNPQMIIPCHCTGDNAVEELRHALGKTVSPGSAGMVFEF